ncbi:hypothetical protein SAMD00019534_064380, partial [Acytostelium subglobosum LB1]|uniref:hypothetical protein n=1 Tax=Acytostelium subglobosum LB1 TaxID=1410327 RepID=UPI0006450C90
IKQFFKKKTMKLLLTLVVLCTIASVGMADFSETERTQLVNQMNTMRMSVVPLPVDGGYQYLNWNATLLDNANTLANACGARYMSEAAAAGTFGESVVTFDYDPSPANVMQALTIGKNSYNFDDNACDDGVNCQAYTNMIWANSQEVACSKVQCADNNFKVACNYYPAGSFSGIQPYTAQDHASASKLATSNFNGLLSFKSNKMVDAEEEELVSKVRVPSTGSFDWRNQGVVAVPEDTKDCGCSFAFTAVGIVQSRVAMREGVRPNLSKQQILDCSDAINPNYCTGGRLNDALIYVRDQGLMKETDYGYVGNSGSLDRQCHYDKNKVVVRGGYVRFSEANKDDIINKCRTFGPVGVAMLGTNDFYDYRSGIFRCDGPVTSTNHSVLLVGYNQEQNYYIVRNNWGTQWGENGFGKISADPNSDCGISNNRAGSIDTVN